jgi:hypothetical protein
MPPVAPNAGHGGGRPWRRVGGGELEAALDVLGLIALKGKVVTADALHCNRRTVAAITGGGGDYYLALKANQDSLLSDARSLFRQGSARPSGRA